MDTMRNLDVRSLPPAGRHAEIFRTFEALKPGEAFVLVNDHDPRPLLYQFQAERAGRFEWSVLEAGPERFRVEIRRRTAEGTRNVTEYLQGDHERLAAILEGVDRLAEAGDFPMAGPRFAEFACGLNRHIDAEETILFPAFEKMTGETRGPTTVMRDEHVRIRARMEKVAGALAERNADGARRAVAALNELLSVHNMKEEEVLYPMTDEAAGGKREQDDLVKRLQAV
jgi:uncharacterized protein (DUF2249 family)/hemerythrin superfamily protein